MGSGIDIHCGHHGLIWRLKDLPSSDYSGIVHKDPNIAHLSVRISNGAAKHLRDHSISKLVDIFSLAKVDVICSNFIASFCVDFFCN